MANSLYGLGRQGFLEGTIDWDTNTQKIILGDSGAYTVSIDVHQFLSSIAGGARIATSSALANKTVALGVADADDVLLSSVTGTSCEFIVIFQDTGVDATSRLIAYIDSAVGLPVTPNGGNITIQWDSGANRIFKL
jgi:hypothetical protein